MPPPQKKILSKMEIVLVATKNSLRLQQDQINMAVLFWFLVKNDACVPCCEVEYTGHWQVRFYKVPEQHGHVKLDTLYLELLAYMVSAPSNLETTRLTSPVKKRGKYENYGGIKTNVVNSNGKNVVFEYFRNQLVKNAEKKKCFF